MWKSRNALVRRKDQGVGVNLLAGDNTNASITPLVQVQYLADHHGLTSNRAALIARLHYGDGGDNA